MTKKLLALALAVLMLLTGTVALGEEHGKFWIGDDITLTYWIPMDSAQAQKYTTLAEHPVMQWMQEQTGVTVEFIHPSYEQQDQQYNLMLTSNNLYDLLYYAYPDGPQAGIDDGVLLDLNLYRDAMPNYTAAISCDDGSHYMWEWGAEKDLVPHGVQPAFEPLLTTSQGNLWCFSQMWNETLAVECGPIIRQDWLDDAGLPMPETLEDLEKVLAAFKARGEDVYPMALGSYGHWGSDFNIMSAFDVNAGWFYQIDGVVQEVGYVSEKYKDYLTLMNKWYELGYIDPDFMNRNHDGMQALFLSDRLGYWGETWSQPDYLKELYEGSDPDFNPVYAPLIRKDKDQQLHLVQGYDSQAYNYTTIWAESENAEAACKWMDVFFSKEGYLVTNYGFEGESYELVDGAPYFTEKFYNEINADDNAFSNYMYQGTVSWSDRARRLANLSTAEVPAPSIEWQQTLGNLSPDDKGAAIWGENASMEYLIGYVVFDGTGWGDMYDPYTEAETYALPMVIKFITGEADIETEWDAYAEKANNMGYAFARDKMQEAYNIQHHLPAENGMN